MYMTISKVARKLSNVIKEAGIKGDLLVTDAMVVKEGDTSGLIQEGFEPGTVIFQCIDSLDKDKTYQIWVNPDQVSKWLN